MTMSAASLAAAVAMIAHHAPAHLPAGARLGTMRIPAIALTAPVVQGGQTLYTQPWPKELQRGPSHYPARRLADGGSIKGALPWQQGTVGFAGHRTTWTHPFRRLNELRKGDAVILRTPWATFWYRVYAMRIVEPSSVWVLTGKAGYRLVLTACHPPRMATYRIAVFARLVSATR